MRITYKGKEVVLPDFLIVGAAKTGTTSLFYYLSKHPNVFLPEEKEPHFFSFYNNPAKFSSPGKVISNSKISSYTALFDKIKPEQIAGEGSTSYLYDYETTIKNIKRIYGEKYNELKIIILLRDPVSRAWSQYWQFRKFYFEPLSFEDAIKDEIVLERMNKNWSYYYDYLGFGNYYSQVEAYINNFSNVKVCLQEELLAETEKVVGEFLEFLDLPLLTEKLDTDRRFNPSGKPKNNLFGKIWKFKNKAIFFKYFKSFIPLKLRKKLIYYFMERAMDKQKMPVKLHQELAKIFEEENKNLYKLVRNKKILKWMK